MFIITIHTAILCTLVEISKQIQATYVIRCVCIRWETHHPTTLWFEYLFHANFSDVNFGTFTMNPNQTSSNSNHPHEFHLELRNTFLALSYYEKNEDGDQQLKFDPPVYQTRYAAVNSVISMEEWIPHIKKVVIFSWITFNAILVHIKGNFMQFWTADHVFVIFDKELIWNIRTRKNFHWIFTNFRNLLFIFILIGCRIRLCRHEYVLIATSKRASWTNFTG